MTYEMFAVEVNTLFVDSRLVIGMKLPPKILTLKVSFEIQVNYVEKINAVFMGLVICCT